MTTTEKTWTARGYQPAPAMNYFGAPQIAFEAPNDQGTDAAAAAAAAAEAAAAEAAAAEAVAQAEADAAAAAAAAAADDANKDKAELASEKAALLKDVMAKKAKLKETNDALTAAQAELAQFKGVDVKKYQALLQAEKDAEVAAATASGDFDRVKAMMAEAHAAEKAELQAEIERLRGESAGAAKVIDGLTIGNDFASSKFISEHLTLSPAKARVIYGGHFESKDGKTVGYDKPAGEANRTLLVDAAGNPLPFDQAFKKIVDADPDKNSVLKANVKPGSGGKTTDASETKKKSDGEDQPYGRALIAQQFFKDGKR